MPSDAHAPPSARDAFLRGARLFDDGAFFEAHEAWEERWLIETDATLRRFFQGLIQVAAGFHKLHRARDRASAARLLEKGIAKLEACPEGIGTPPLGRFRDDVRAWTLALSAATPPSSAAPALPTLLVSPARSTR